jgi:uncharacterized phage protein (TIGR02220 family)
MNYYERWCADYVKKTLGLRMLEHGAYTRLLDAYYIGNGPLPDHLPTLFTIAGASTKDERAAVQKIVDQYFPLGSDGMRHNERADEEIAKYYKRIEASHVNGSKGGRPRTRNPAGFARKPNGNPMGYPAHNPAHNPIETPSCTTTSPKGLKPLPDSPNGESSSGSAPDLSDLAGNRPRPPDDKAVRTRALRAEAVGLLEFLNEKTGRAYEPVPANVDPIVSLLKAGATTLKVRQVIAKRCREWSTDPKMAAFLRPKTLFNRTNFANYAGEIVEVPADEEDANIERAET